MKEKNAQKRMPSCGCAARMTRNKLHYPTSNAAVSKQGLQSVTGATETLVHSGRTRAYSDPSADAMLSLEPEEKDVVRSVPWNQVSLGRQIISTKDSNSLWAMPLGVILTGLGSQKELIKDGQGKAKGAQMFDFRRKLLAGGSLKQTS